MDRTESPLIRALYSDRFTVRHQPYDPSYPDSAEYWQVIHDGRIIIDGISSELRARNDALNLMTGYEMALDRIWKAAR
jgi:hypothetical protein